MANNQASETKEAPEKKKQKSLVREYVEAIGIALILALFIREFFVQAFKIPSGSMRETLQVGDHILVSKFNYGIHLPNQIPFTDIVFYDDYRLFPKTPKRHDIIVFKFPKDETRDFIKRVIGLPGEILEIRGQKVYINDKPLDDPHANHSQPPGESLIKFRDDFGPVRIPEGHLFVMGDNRENSQDSRFWGFLKMDKIKGKAQMIYWSWDKYQEKVPMLKGWVRSDRFGKMLD